MNCSKIRRQCICNSLRFFFHFFSKKLHEILLLCFEQKKKVHQDIYKFAIFSTISISFALVYQHYITITINLFCFFFLYYVVCFFFSFLVEMYIFFILCLKQIAKILNLISNGETFFEIIAIFNQLYV